MKTIVAWLLCVATSQAAYLDFSGVMAVPAILPDNSVISQLGTPPDNITIEAPQPDQLETIISLDPGFFGITFESADDNFRMVTGSNFGFRIDFAGHSNATMTPYTRNDDMLMALQSDGIWTVLDSLPGDWIGDGTDTLTTTRGLRQPDGLSLAPIWDGLRLENASYFEWVLTDFVAHPAGFPLAAGIGHISTSLVPEPGYGWISLWLSFWLLTYFRRAILIRKQRQVVLASTR